MKTCSKCKVEKELGAFSRDRARKDGFHVQCKECQKKDRLIRSDYIKKYNYEYRVSGRNRHYTLKCIFCQTIFKSDKKKTLCCSTTCRFKYIRAKLNIPEKYTEKQRKQHYHLYNKYGVALENKRKIYEDQGGVCPICHKSLDFDTAHLDHDHNNGNIRGVLHPLCNRRILGLVENYPQETSQAILYLQNFSKKF